MAADLASQVRGPSGLGTRRLPAARTPELLAGASIPVSVPVDDVPALGRLAADVALAPAAVGASDVTAEPVVATQPATAVPWTTLALLLAVAVLLGVLRRRRARRVPGPADRPTGTTPTSTPTRTTPTVEARP